jgi:hypothetical protein
MPEQSLVHPVVYDRLRFARRLAGLARANPLHAFGFLSFSSRDLLDEDISVEGIVAGRRPMESAESFRRWLQDRKDRSLD